MSEITERFFPNSVSEEESEIMDGFRQEFAALADKIDNAILNSRYKSMAITALEEAALWTTKSITHGQIHVP